MRRWLASGLLVVLLSGCHHVTGLDGLAGDARHSSGYHILSLVTLWLSVFAMVAGVAFVTRSVVRRRDRDQRIWAWTLTTVGVVLFLGTAYSSFGLWVCHGTC